MRRREGLLGWLGSLLLVAALGCAKQPPIESPPSSASPSSAALAPSEPEANAAPPAGEPTVQADAPPPRADENGETRTLEVVADIVKSRREEVRACYDAAEEKYPGIQGDVMIRFVIAPDGHVQSLTFSKEESTLKFQELADCMMAKMKQWKFPSSSLGMESRIGYPFNFNPKRR